MPNIVKNTTFPGPLDLLAPHSCRGCGRIGYAICDRCKKYILNQHQNLCPACKSDNPTGTCKHCHANQSFPLPPTFTIGERSGLLGQVIHDYKYQSIRALSRPLAELLNESVPTFSQPVTIIPLPTSSRHVRARALDHTSLIAKHFANLHANYHVEKFLLRTNSTVQVGASHAAREKQAASAFKLNPRAKINPSATYALLDDVWTTGASLKSAIKKLRQAGASNIILLILAVSRTD